MSDAVDIKKQAQSPEEHYKCGISGMIMAEPVVADDEHIYEKEWLEEIIARGKPSPITGQPIKSMLAVRKMGMGIAEYLKANAELYYAGKVYLPRAWIRELFSCVYNGNLDRALVLLERDPRLLEYKFEADNVVLLQDSSNVVPLQDSFNDDESKKGKQVPVPAVVAELNSVLIEPKFKEINDSSYTTFQLACEFGTPEMVDRFIILLNSKNKLPAPDAQKPKNFNPKVLNALLLDSLNNFAQPELQSKNLDLLPRLGANVEQTDAVGKTLLHKFAEAGNVAAINWLLSNNANITSVDNQENTALHNAILANNVNILQITELLLAAGLGVNLVNIDGNSFLHMAVEQAADEVVKLLLKKNANYKMKNNKGEKPAKLARSKGKIAIAKIIEQFAYDIEENLKKSIGYMRQQDARINELTKALGRAEATIAKLVGNLEVVPVVAKPVGTASPEKTAVPAIRPAHSVSVEEAQQFLTYVVQGRQDEAEAMLKFRPEIAVALGTVTDHAGREFRGMSGLQVAICNLDWYMWEMMLQYIPLEVARENVQELVCSEECQRLQAEILQVWKDLMKEYQVYIDMPWNDMVKCTQQWTVVIGGLQKRLPVHVLQEYCHPTRAFSLDLYTPDMFKAAVFPRKDIFGPGANFEFSKLAVDFAIYRCTRRRGACEVRHDKGRPFNPALRAYYDYDEQFRDLDDFGALDELLHVRTEQRDELLTRLKVKATVAKPK